MTFIKSSIFVYFLVMVFALSMLPNQSLIAQAQVIGSFPEIQGGIENQTAGTCATNATIATGVVKTAYTNNGTSGSASIVNNNAVARSGNYYLSWDAGSTSNKVYSPTASNAAILNTTAYTVQFYYQKNSSASARKFTIGVCTDGTSGSSTTTTASTLPNTTWTLQQISVTSGSSSNSPRYGLVSFTPSGGSWSGFPYLLDDICVYAGSADNTAPDDPSGAATSNPTSNSLDLSWTAPVVGPGNGIDGGGYVVVRYTTDPSILPEPAPNVHGIYGVGNSIGAGTVAYVGTATSFTDNGLTANTTYFYRVYVADKAFNYCVNPTTCNGYTGVVGTPAVSLTSPDVVAAGFIDQGSVNNPIYRFRLTATTAFATLNSISFQNTVGYNNTDFTNFKLYASNTNTFPGGSPIATITSPSASATQTFSGFTKTITSSTTYFWITADVLATAVPGNTITVNPALDSAHCGFAATLPTVSVSTSSGGTQTIRYATALTDYFRSVASGNWSSTGTWQSSHDGISSWTSATIAPANTATNVTIQNGHVVTVDANLSAPNILVNNGGELTSSGFTITPSGADSIVVNGKLSVTASTKVVVSTVNNLKFGATGLFYLNANGGYLPPADWNASATAYITGWTTATKMTGDDGTAATQVHTVGQPKSSWGNLTFDFPGITVSGTAKILTGFNTGSTAGTITISGNLTLLRTNSNVVQVFTSSGVTGITAQNININCGSWLFNNAAYTVNVNNQFRMVDSLSATVGYSVAALNFGTSAADILNVSGNFIQTIGTITSNATNQNIRFVGGSPQNATFNTLTNAVNIEINNAAGVNLSSNLTLPGALTLTSGVFNVNGFTFNLTGTIATVTSSVTASSVNSTVVFTGPPAIPANFFTGNTVYNLNINNASGDSTASNLSVTDTLKLITGTLKIGAGTKLTLAGAALSSTGGFISGTSTSDFEVNGSTGGTVNLPLSVALDIKNFAVNGTRTLIMNGTKDININTGGTFTLASGATYDNGGQSQLTKAGTPASPTFLISGWFITRATGGFAGTNAAISSSYVSADINLNSGSTVEYGLSGNQAVQGSTVPAYQTVIFSNSGTKTLASTNAVATLIAISGSAILDAGSFNFGTTGTNLTMTGTSRFITGGAGLKPDATGTYTLGASTTIEFAYNSATDIRRPASATYTNIVVSGTNVNNTTTATPIRFLSGGTFTVNNGATFKLANTTGFTGGTTTAISSTNSPSISLLTGSTIDYNGASQTITNGTTYQHLNMSGTGTKTAPAGILTVQGNLTNTGSGVFDANGGTVLLNGASQSFAGFAYNNLLLDNAGTKTLLANASVKDSIKIGNTSTNPATILSLGSNFLTMLSTATKTARVATVAPAASVSYGTGRFVIERYYPAHRAWRLTTTPLTADPTRTMFSSWQNNGVYIPNAGTFITSPTPSPGNGMDASPQNNYSLKKYNGATQTFVNIDSTINLPISGTNGVAGVPDNVGYFLFVRGDRNPLNLDPVNANFTTLRDTGKIQFGSQSFSTNATVGNYTLIGNPYASPIDFDRLNFTNVPKKFWAWDPNLNQVGGYVLVDGLGGNYITSPSVGTGITKNLQSSQAIFVMSSVAGGGSVVFNESNKTDSNNLTVFRNANAIQESMSVSLYKFNPDNSLLLADGAVAQFDDAYSSLVDWMDGVKFGNVNEQLSFVRNNHSLAIERRPTVTVTDTLFLKLTKTGIYHYRFVCNSNHLDHPGMQGVLVDHYTGIEHPLDLNGETAVDFDITSDQNSAGTNRFFIVFRPLNVVPVTFLEINAEKTNANNVVASTKSVNVTWKVANELNIDHYEVERSDDGHHFYSLSVVRATGNGTTGTIIYQWQDHQVIALENYYRIKSTDNSGNIKYSPIVKVVQSVTKAPYTVYPNPVKDGIIHLYFNDLPAGNYQFRLVNSLGQVVLESIIKYPGGEHHETISMNSTYVKGIYNLELINPFNQKTYINLQIIN